jgi:hypothetical protein
MIVLPARSVDGFVWAWFFLKFAVRFCDGRRLLLWSDQSGQRGAPPEVETTSQVMNPFATLETRSTWSRKRIMKVLLKNSKFA